MLLHAGVADRRMWAGLLDPLAAAGGRVLAPDLPGYGEAELSPGPSSPWSDVLETLDAHGIERFALAGNSYGGLIAKRIAVLAPERVSALALISAPPEDAEGEPSPELSAIWEAEEDALEREDLDAAVATIVDAWTLPGAPPEQRELVAEMQRRAFALQLAAGEPEYGPDPVEEDPGAFARLEVPAVIAYGEYDLPDFRRSAESLAAALPRASVVEIAGAGHLAPLERPGAVVELLGGLPKPPS